MSRNFHKPDDYQWEKNPQRGTVTCHDADNLLFAVFDEGSDAIALNAYWAGRYHGERIGADKAKRDIREAIGLKE